MTGKQTADALLNDFLARAVPAIRATWHPEKILLFGSRVRGDAREHSDLDVILVARSFAEFPFVWRPGRVVATLRAEGIAG